MGAVTVRLMAPAKPPEARSFSDRLASSVQHDAVGDSAPEAGQLTSPALWVHAALTSLDRSTGGHRYWGICRDRQSSHSWTASWLALGPGYGQSRVHASPHPAKGSPV